MFLVDEVIKNKHLIPYLAVPNRSKGKIGIRISSSVNIGQLVNSFVEISQIKIAISLHREHELISTMMYETCNFYPNTFDTYSPIQHELVLDHISKFPSIKRSLLLKNQSKNSQHFTQVYCCEEVLRSILNKIDGTFLLR